MPLQTEHPPIRNLENFPLVHTKMLLYNIIVGNFRGSELEDAQFVKAFLHYIHSRVSLRSK